jgi:hypothetical protein
MGTFLATPLLAALIILWMIGTLLISASRLRLAEVSLAPRGNFPNSRKIYSSEAAPRTNADSNGALGEVKL